MTLFRPCDISDLAADWPEREAARLAALEKTGLLDSGPEPAFDRLTRLAARLLDAPVAMVSLVAEDRQYFKSAVGLSGESAQCRETPREQSFCRHVVEGREPFSVGDARTHAVMCSSPLIEEMATVAYLGVPILLEGGEAIGSLCVTDHQPREWTSEDVRTLTELAAIAVTEITLRIRAKEQALAMGALRDSEDRFRQLTESIHEVFWLATPAVDQVLFASPAYDEVWQQSRAELYRSPDAWSRVILPDDIAGVEASSARLRAGQNSEVEYRISRKDGSIRWIRDRGFPIFDDEGVVVRICGVAEDVTPRKEAEIALQAEMANRQKAELHLLRAQRLESIGTLASGLAHDLNNLLSPILMSAPLLREQQSAETRAELASTVERCAERAAGIVKQVLTFARGLEGERQPLRPKDLIREINRMISETFPRNINVQCVPQIDLDLVAGDSTQLHQVIMNLCVNARDAMPHGGTLVLRAENFQVDESYAGMTPGAHAGSYVKITISDTGIGIPRENVEKIFDPFFTTKPVGKGTGLGLSTALGIVKSHGGFMDVKSQPGHGTRFSVFLPALEDGRMAGTEVPAAVHVGNGQTVLIVDDECEVLKTAATALNQHGYRTLTACDGVEALSIYAAQRGEIRAVLTDIVMPLVDGVALCRALRKMEPQLPIVALTGWGDEIRIQELASLSVTELLLKPFRNDTLLASLGKVLAVPHAA